MVNNVQSQVEPPGYFIQQELEARGWTQTDLAYIVDMLPQQLNPILKGKNSITADKAMLFGEAFGMPPKFFTNLENDYQLSKAKAASPAVKKRAVWQASFPVREMIKRGWIEETDPSLLETQMLRFFEKLKVDDMPYFGGNNAPVVGYAAKKTLPCIPSPEELAWVYRVRQIAKMINVPTYSKEKLTLSLDKLKAMRGSLDDIGSIPSILNECGVRFVIVETLPKAKIDGVCTWLDTQPVIALSNRYDRIDNFWFVLRHEIEHVLQGHGKEATYPIVDNLDGDNGGLGSGIPDDERMANEAAAEFCVSQSQLKSFIDRKSPYISEKDVIGFARRLEVHPALVVGQLQRAMNKWTFLRKYLSSSVSGVRKTIVLELQHQNIIDGWGLKVNAQL